MADLPALSTRWLADHHGVITAARLRDHGVSRATRQRLVSAGFLRSVAKGVYVIATAPVTLEQRCTMLCAAHPGGFVTGATAGILAGLRRMPRSSALHFSTNHGLHVTQDMGIHFRQTTVIWTIDRYVRPDGIIVASWARLAFDLAADLPQLDHVSVVQQLLHEQRVTTDELVAIDRRLGHPTRPGSGVFRRTLSSLGSAPNESHPEVVLADALRRRDIPIEHQTQVNRAVGGRTARIDLAVPSIRWGIELDIHPEHRTFDGHARDAQRRRNLHGAAWQIEVVTELDMADVEALADELLQNYRLRSIQSSAS